MMDSQELRPAERCAVCDREAPSATLDPERGTSPRVAEGWSAFEDGQELVVVLPYPESLTLPLEIADAIRNFDGLIRIDYDRHEAPQIVEVHGIYAGLVCSTCYSDPERAGWDITDWLWFLTGLQREKGGGDS